MAAEEHVVVDVNVEGSKVEQIDVKGGSPREAGNGMTLENETERASDGLDVKKEGDAGSSPGSASTTEDASNVLKRSPSSLTSDPALNDALGQLQLLLTMSVGSMFGIRWPSPAISERLIRAGFCAEIVNTLPNLCKKDLEISLDRNLRYLGFLLQLKSCAVGAVCKVLLRVRGQIIIMDTETTEKTLADRSGFRSETGVAAENLLLRTLNELLGSVRFSTPAELEDLSQKESEVLGKVVDICFYHFDKHHKTLETKALHSVIQLTGRLSLFSLRKSLENFEKKMSAVYFNSSALEFVPYMRILATKANFSLFRSPSCSEASVSFLKAMSKLLRKTSCPELILESFQCLSSLAKQIQKEAKGLERRSSSDSQPSQGGDESGEDNADLEQSCEDIFRLAHYYCSRGKYVPQSLDVMENLIAMQIGIEKNFPSLEGQHETICLEILQRIRDLSARISGLDHMQKYLQGLEKRKVDVRPLEGLQAVLFIDGAIPRSQETALMSAILVELARLFPRLFDIVVDQGLISERATSAQKAICLNALAQVAARVPSGASSPLRSFTKFVVQYSSRETPAPMVAEALACFPMLGEHSMEMLNNCVEAAFGYDVTLFERGQDALIRFCLLGGVNAEKAMSTIVNHSSLQFICTRQREGKDMQPTKLFILRTTTLAAIVRATLSRGSPTPEFMTEAGAKLVLARTFPNKEVRAIADSCLALFDEKDMDSIERRAVEKLMLGLLGSGGADVLHERTQHLERKEAGFPDLLHWWRTQGTFLLRSKAQNPNKQAFVRGLVNEYFSSKSPAMKDAALHALSFLTDRHDIVERQITLRSLQIRNELFNGCLVRLLAAFSDTYVGGDLQNRIEKSVAAWLHASTEELSRMHMSKWSDSVIEGACRILRKFTELGGLDRRSDRDRAVLLINEWCRQRETTGSMPAVASVFLVVLKAGPLESVEAQTCALRMLSVFPGFKKNQPRGLRHLLTQNLGKMFDQYHGTVMRSFDSERWENHSEVLDIRQPFVTHIVSALLFALDCSSDLDSKMKHRMMLVVPLLCFHPVENVRNLVSKWSTASAFLGTPHEAFPEAFASRKIPGDDRAVLLAEFLASSVSQEGIVIDDIFHAATRVCGHLTEAQVAVLVRILQPWLLGHFPSGAKDEKTVITRLLRLCAKLKDSDKLAWRIWRSIDLQLRFKSVIEAMVEFSLLSEEKNNVQTTQTAFANLCLAKSQRGPQDKVVDLLGLIVQCLPEASFENMKGVSQTDPRSVKVILELFCVGPFLLRKYQGEDLARLLFSVLVEEDFAASATSHQAMKAISEEFPALQHDAPIQILERVARSKSSESHDIDWLQELSSVHSPETARHLSEFATLCIIKCTNPVKRSRSFSVIQNVTLEGLPEDRILALIREMINKVIELLGLLEAGKGDQETPERLEALDHVFLLAELFSSIPLLQKSAREDLVILAGCGLSIPIVFRPNPFQRIRTCAVNMIMLAAEHTKGDPVIQEHLVSSLAHRETAVNATKALLTKFLTTDADTLMCIFLVATICAHNQEEARMKEILQLISNAVDEDDLGFGLKAVKGLLERGDNNRELIRSVVGAIVRLESEVVAKGCLRQCIQFLVFVIRRGESTWGPAALHLVKEFSLHKEFQEVFDAEEIQGKILNSMSEALQDWPSNMQEVVFSTLALLPLRIGQSFNLIEAKRTTYEEKQKRLVQGIALAREQIIHFN